MLVICFGHFRVYVSDFGDFGNLFWPFLCLCVSDFGDFCVLALVILAIFMLTWLAILAIFVLMC